MERVARLRASEWLLREMSDGGGNEEEGGPEEKRGGLPAPVAGVDHGAE